MRVEAAPVASPAEAGSASGEHEGGNIQTTGTGGGGLSSATRDERLRGFERARARVKALLAVHRNCLPLWGAYAQLEAAGKQHKSARRVYNAALTAAASSSAGSATGFAGSAAAALVLSAAEAEMSCGGADAKGRALHVLVWLGVGGSYTPFESFTKVPQVCTICSSHFRMHVRYLCESTRCQPALPESPCNTCRQPLIHTGNQCCGVQCLEGTCDSAVI